MKRNKIFVLGLVAVFVATLSLTLVSGTWARYTSTVTGSSTARVAKWAFSFNGTDEADLAQEVSFNLFNTVNDENVKKTDEGETPIIAPGTSGKLEFSLKNLSEVSAEAVLKFIVTNENNIPVKFYKSNAAGEKGVEITLADGYYTVGSVELGYDGKTGENVKSSDTLYLMWEWPFSGNDATDTNLGIVGTAEITVTATVVFTQVD